MIPEEGDWGPGRLGAGGARGIGVDSGGNVTYVSRIFVLTNI